MEQTDLRLTPSPLPHLVERTTHVEQHLHLHQLPRQPRRLRVEVPRLHRAATYAFALALTRTTVFLQVGEGSQKRLAFAPSPHLSPSYAQVAATVAQRQLARRATQQHQRGVLLRGGQRVDQVGVGGGVAIEGDLRLEEGECGIGFGRVVETLQLFEEVRAECVAHTRQKEGKKTGDVLEGKVAQPVFRRGVDGNDGRRRRRRLWNKHTPLLLCPEEWRIPWTARA